MSNVYSRAVLVLAIAIGGACSSQSNATDERVANLEKQLAEANTRLEAIQATPVQQAPATLEQASPVAAPPAAAAPAKPASTTQRKPARPPESQKNASGGQVVADQSRELKIIEQQRAVNAEQAEINTRLQQEVERLTPREFTLAAGTLIPVRTTAELSSAKLSTGSVFEATLENDLRSGDTVLAKARSRVTGFVVSSDPGGRVKGTASLAIGVRSIVGVKGDVIAIRTDSHIADADSTKKKDAVRTGIATGVGAIIGGIAGGGSGAAKGAGAGAATGVGVSLATRGAAAIIPAEALIEFHLSAPVTVVMQP